MKDGQVIHSIPLQQPATLFGRLSLLLCFLLCCSFEDPLALSPS